MKIYKKLIKPMMLVPASANDYSPKKVPIDGEEKWYPEENREALAEKYKHLETTFETLVFEEKYEEIEIKDVFCYSPRAYNEVVAMDMDKVIKGLETCYIPPSKCEGCPYHHLLDENICNFMLCFEALSLLKEFKVRELTMDEWKEWKANTKRDPICMLWENDLTPMWILDPTDVHEPALLMGKLKLFTGKPTFEQCKEAKWK